MVYTSEEVKEISHAVLIDGEVKKLILVRNDGTFIEVPVDVPKSVVSLSTLQIPAAKDSFELQRQSNVFSPKIVTLIAGQDDEANPAAVSCVASKDVVDFKIGTQAWKLTTAGAVTAQAIWDPPGGAIGNDPVVLSQPPCAFGIWVNIPDVTKLTGSVELDLYTDLGLTHQWVASKLVSSLVNGWNLIRFHAGQGTIVNAEWGTLYRLRVIFQTNAATSITIGHIFAETSNKAQAIFVADGPYANSFYTQGAYAQLKARGIPVTFAIDPGLLGSSSGVSLYMSEAQLKTAMADGNGNAIGAHSWDSTLTATMTSAQIIANVLQTQKWMEQRGWHPIWRPAWLQNLATNAAAAQPFYLAYATPNAQSGIQCWPPIDRWNISRMAVHGWSQANMDSYFTQLQTTHQFMCCYIHGVDNIGSGGGWITQANWDYFLSKVDTALGEGWLEFTTFEQLVARSGVKHKQTFGDTLTEYFDFAGVRQTMRIP